MNVFVLIVAMLFATSAWGEMLTPIPYETENTYTTGENDFFGNPKKQLSDNAVDIKNFFRQELEKHLLQAYRVPLLICGEEKLPFPELVQCTVDYVNSKSIHDSDMYFYGTEKAKGDYLFQVIADKFPKAGIWANVPTAGLFDGMQYFDTVTNKPYWYHVEDVVWYDAAGVAHP